MFLYIQNEDGSSIFLDYDNIEKVLRSFIESHIPTADLPSFFVEAFDEIVDCSFNRETFSLSIKTISRSKCSKDSYTKKDMIYFAHTSISRKSFLADGSTSLLLWREK